jgi:altronate hydrolase
MATAAGSPRAVLLRGDDNVAVAARPIPKGYALDLTDVTLEVREPIDLGHKVSLRAIAEGEPVRKYGQIIGFASRDIAAGSHVHVHNLRADLFERDYAFASERPPGPAPERPRTFQGFLRPDGRVGTRNYIAVISTVNCSASTSRSIADRFRDGRWRSQFPNIDGVFAITHKGGCGLPFEGLDHQILERVLAGFAHHPNVAAYVIVGLGCEGAYAQHLVESQQLTLLHAPGNGSQAGRNQPARPYRPRVLNIQEEGGIARTVEAAVRAVGELMPEANGWRRSEQPASKICLAMECGGSDGNSGVTANPALGVAADLVIAQGGSAVLGETTEIYGAEHLLTRRAVTREVGQKLVDRIKWWEWYTGVFGARIDNNPSPGNKAGGLTTIYEKSLGALAKAGSTPLVDVVPYAAVVTSPGLVFMDTPGYDPPCTTGLVASGANVLVFTTGRGSVLGLKPTPCIKLATNTPMYDRMSDDMDMNAGTILEGEPVETVGRRLFELIMQVASGTTTRSEQEEVGEEEFAPWTIGPTL